MPENPYPPHELISLQRQVDRHDTQLIDHERRLVVQELRERHDAADVVEVKADMKEVARASDVQDIKDQLRWITRMVAGALVTGVIGVALAVAADRIF